MNAIARPPHHVDGNLHGSRHASQSRDGLLGPMMVAIIGGLMVATMLMLSYSCQPCTSPSFGSRSRPACHDQCDVHHQGKIFVQLDDHSCRYTPVTSDYTKGKNRFTKSISKWTITLNKMLRTQRRRRRR